ncbi:MAG TPA: helix-turn-helix domain-containing protein [Chlamydiales bacterium]|jgi:3-methyladenine DNA glycosylase Tag|nr:helix-turn-helix domain-containing protein [Chlamydiales bacterium]
MAIEVITKEDLQEFRMLLLADLEKLINSKSPKQKQWLKSSEVRQMLKISPGTLQNLRINGSLSFTKIGGTIFYNYDDLESMIESNKVEAYRKPS